MAVAPYYVSQEHPLQITSGHQLSSLNVSATFISTFTEGVAKFTNRT
jgi:hypothetical protein